MSMKANTARAPPWRADHSRSCRVQMISASVWLRRFEVALTAGMTDMDGQVTNRLRVGDCYRSPLTPRSRAPR